MKINKQAILEGYTMRQNMAQVGGLLGGAALGAGLNYAMGDGDMMGASAGAGAALGSLGVGTYVAKNTKEGQQVEAAMQQAQAQDLEAARSQKTLNPVAKILYR